MMKRTASEPRGGQEAMRPLKTARHNNTCHDYVIVSEASPDLFAPLVLLHKEVSLGHAVRVYTSSGTTGKYFLPPGDPGVDSAVLDGVHLPAAIAMGVLRNFLEIETLDLDYAKDITNDRCVDVVFHEKMRGPVVFASRCHFEANTAKYAAVLACRRTVAARVIEAFAAKYVYAKSGGAWSKEGVNRTTRHLAGSYVAKYPDTSSLALVSFLEAGAIVQEDEILAAARDFLSSVVALVNRCRHDRPLISGVVSVRVLTAASLTAAHPNDSFEELGQTEVAMIEAAKRLIPRMAEVAGALHAGERWSVAQAATALEGSLSSMVCRYLVAFQKWKVGDERMVARRIEHTLDVIAAERASECKDVALVERLDEQAAELRTRLAGLSIKRPKSLCGEGTKAPASVADIVEDTPTCRPQSSRNMGGLSNEQLAQELMLDRNFRVTDDTVSEDHLVEVRVRKVFERAFTRSLVDYLMMQPPRYGRVISMLEEFHHALTTLARTRTIRNDATVLLDIPRLSHDLKSGSMGNDTRHLLLSQLSHLVCRVHADVAGDEAAKALRAALDLADRGLSCAVGVRGCAVATCSYLEAVQDRIGVARTDLGNQRLRGVAVVVGQHGVEFARNNFQALLDSGEITMDSTIEWIRESVRKCDGDPSTGICAADLLKGSPEDFQRVLHHATVNMIISGSGDSPATYRLDVVRIKSLRQHFKMDVRVFSLLTTAYAVTAARSPAHTRAVVKAVAAVLVPSGQGGCRDIGLWDVRKAIVSAGVGTRDTGDIMAVVARNSDPGSAVGRAAAKIIRKVWLGILRDGYFPLDMKFSAAADAMKDGIVSRCTKLGGMINLSKAIFVEEYNDFILSAARIVVAT